MIKEKDKKETWKEKRRRKLSEFEEKHPKLYDFLVKATAVTVVVGPIAAAYFVGYSDGSKISPKAIQENFEKTDEEMQKLHQEWLQKQREVYLQNFNGDQYRENAAEFMVMAENMRLQPGEAFFLWDNNQFRGENLPVEPMVDHQVYGISDPAFNTDESTKDYNPWEMD